MTKRITARIVAHIFTVNNNSGGMKDYTWLIIVINAMNVAGFLVKKDI